MGQGAGPQQLVARPCGPGGRTHPSHQLQMEAVGSGGPQSYQGCSWQGHGGEGNLGHRDPWWTHCRPWLPTRSVAQHGSPLPWLSPEALAGDLRLSSHPVILAHASSPLHGRCSPKWHQVIAGREALITASLHRELQLPGAWIRAWRHTLPSSQAQHPRPAGRVYSKQVRHQDLGDRQCHIHTRTDS